MDEISPELKRRFAELAVEGKKLLGDLEPLLQEVTGLTREEREAKRVLSLLEDRDMRRTFKMFGTTGFWDVDRRLRMKEIKMAKHGTKRKGGRKK